MIVRTGGGVGGGRWVQKATVLGDTIPGVPPARVPAGPIDVVNAVDTVENSATIRRPSTVARGERRSMESEIRRYWQVWERILREGGGGWWVVGGGGVRTVSEGG